MMLMLGLKYPWHWSRLETKIEGGTQAAFAVSGAFVAVMSNVAQVNRTLDSLLKLAADADVGDQIIIGAARVW